MTDTAAVSYYEAGEPIPEWLIAQEPTLPTAVPLEMRFNTRCILVETPDKYIIVGVDADRLGVEPLAILNGRDCTIYAPSKRVFIARVSMAMTPDTDAHPNSQTLVFNRKGPGTVEIEPGTPMPLGDPEASEAKRKLDELFSRRRMREAADTAMAPAPLRTERPPTRWRNLETGEITHGSPPDVPEPKPGLFLRLWRALKGD
jgi:hypothetical protein